MRKATMEDCSAIETLYRVIINELEQGVNYPLWHWGVHPDEEMVRAAIEAGQMYIEYGLEDQAVAVGQLIVGEPLEPDGIVWGDEGLYGSIHLFGVRPDQKGSGLAGHCLNDMMDEARKAGCSSIRLDLIVGNVPARRLYLRHGFVSRGRCDIDLPREGVLHFELMEHIFD